MEGNGRDQDGGYLRAKAAALRFLGHRGRSESEVRLRLGRRYDTRVVDRVVAVLKGQGYLDDAAFARQWRWLRERHRPRGQGLLRQELLRLGVAPETVREALADFDAGDNAYRAGRKLALRLAGIGYPQFRQSLWPHLQRRGFDSAVIAGTVRRLWQELADPLHREIDASQDEK